MRWLVLFAIACGGSSAPAPSSNVATAEPAIRLVPLRERVLAVPEGLAFLSETACLEESDPRFGGTFTGGPTRIVSFSGASAAIDAWESCAGGYVNLEVSIKGFDAIRYHLYMVEAGILVYVKNGSAWERACDGRTCEAGKLKPDEVSFWTAQWAPIKSIVDDLSDPIVALEKALHAARDKAPPRSK